MYSETVYGVFWYTGSQGQLSYKKLFTLQRGRKASVHSSKKRHEHINMPFYEFRARPVFKLSPHSDQPHTYDCILQTPMLQLPMASVQKLCSTQAFLFPIFNFTFYCLYLLNLYCRSIILHSKFSF